MLKPDEAMGAFALILEDVCGAYAAMRKEPISDSEWEAIVERVQTMAAMNKKEERP